jgi:hypothetical protein
VLSFVNGFGGTVTGNDTFTLLNSNAALAGTFANVASGGRLTTSDGSGSFVVNYNGNTIAIGGFAPVPGTPAAPATAGPLPDSTSSLEPVRVAEISAALPANPAEALLLTPVAPAPLPTAAIASDPAPQNRTATSGARNAGRSRENEMPRPRTDRIRPVAIHVRDSINCSRSSKAGQGNERRCGALRPTPERRATSLRRHRQETSTRLRAPTCLKRSPSARSRRLRSACAQAPRPSRGRRTAESSTSRCLVRAGGEAP